MTKNYDIDYEGVRSYAYDATRECIYCGAKIKPQFVVCKTCYPMFQEYRDADFQKELIMAETKRKRAEYDDWVAENVSADHVKEAKRMLTKETIMQIYQLHDSGLGYKRIAKELELPVTTVAYYFSGKSKKHAPRIDVGRRSVDEDDDEDGDD